MTALIFFCSFTRHKYNHLLAKKQTQSPLSNRNDRRKISVISNIITDKAFTWRNDRQEISGTSNIISDKARQSDDKGPSGYFFPASKHLYRTLYQKKFKQIPNNCYIYAV